MTSRGGLFLVLPLLLLSAVSVGARTPSHTLLSNSVTAVWSNSVGTRFGAEASVIHVVSNLIDFNLSSAVSTAAVGETTCLPVHIGVSNNFSDRFRLLVRANAVTDMRVRVYADVNGNGLVDGADRPITNTDPAGEGSSLHLLLSIFVPPWIPAGTTNTVVMEAVTFRSNAMLNGRVFSTNRIVTAVYSNLVTVISAADRVKTVTVFNGSAALSDEDVRVTVRFGLPPRSTNGARLWYDVGSTPDGPYGTNAGDRSVPLVFNGVNWSAVIPGSDGAIVDGVTVRFVVEVDHEIYTPGAADSWKYVVRSRPDQGDGFIVFPTIVDLSTGGFLNMMYRVQRAGRIVIVIYDLKGDFVKRFDEGDRQAGDYGPVLWNGDNHDGTPVASGLYFVNIRGNSLNETRKVIVVK